ncbi:hypothetical protein DVH05_008891 [Phytophthora capsici]|nr:hypothetical protein DVH05_008891 [Phytophthora capsici]
MEIPLPDVLSCRLTIKSGQPYTACRDKVAPCDFVFRVANGPRVLRASIEEKFEASLPGQSTSSFDVYLKPSKHAPQKDYAKLCTSAEAFQAQLETVWHRARLRKDGQASFTLLLFVYVPKPVGQTTLRRATEARIQQQLPRVAAFLDQQGVVAGPASRNYMAVTQARLPEGSNMQVPDSATFRQLQSIDAQQAAIDESQVAETQICESEYRVVRIKIHDVPVPVAVNISDLREALGLPAYSLRPPFRPQTSIDTPDPPEDMIDVGHQ